MASTRRSSPSICGRSTRRSRLRTSPGSWARKNRQAAAIEPLTRVRQPSLELTADTASAIVADLIAVQDIAGQIRAALASVAGLGTVVPLNPFQLGALSPVHVPEWMSSKPPPSAFAAPPSGPNGFGRSGRAGPLMRTPNS